MVAERVNIFDLLGSHHTLGGMKLPVVLTLGVIWLAQLSGEDAHIRTERARLSLNCVQSTFAFRKPGRTSCQGSLAGTAPMYLKEAPLSQETSICDSEWAELLTLKRVLFDGGPSHTDAKSSETNCMCVSRF